MDECPTALDCAENEHVSVLSRSDMTCHCASLGLAGRAFAKVRELRLPRAHFNRERTASQNIERLLAAGRRKCFIQRQAILGVEGYRARADVLLHVLER